VDREALYQQLPIPFQNVALSLEGWRLRRRRYDHAFESVLEAYQRRAVLRPEEVCAYRDERIRDFVAHAVRTTPWWRERFAALGLVPANISGLDDLSVLPPLEKETVRAEPHRFRAEGREAASVIMSHTSGTTGSGLVFPVSREAEREQWAVWWRYREVHDISRNEWCLYFGGRSLVPLKQRHPPFWRSNRPGRQLMFSAYHLSDATAAAYLEACRASGHRWMHGYPSQLALLAIHARRLGVRLPALRWITVGAESLLPVQRRQIEEAFGVAPVQHYGMAEGVANFSECPDGALHVDEDYAGVEFEPVGEGRYRILGTNFTNTAFPLIRYAVGDLVELGDAPCGCGRAGRVVSHIDGRIEDYVTTKSGVRIGRLDHVFKDMVHVVEAQVRQRRPGEIRVLVVPRPEFDAAQEALLRYEIATRVGADMQVDIERVQMIDRTGGGKFRFVVQERP
jgi:phenylacetate-CoA ligase